MRSPHDIIRRVTLTEKGTRLQEQGNQYLFEVYPSANKIEIKHAIEELFKVKVDNVNTLNRIGKPKRDRRSRMGRTAAQKRAIVTLKQGDTIELT
ncbi:MAG: 50S ribosomal protein L23 [Verrucomicrobia bacterium]|nr:50S ribosomal protein L23 [Kiritimatiellia bacterium]MCB1102606.1 50S ribosomal protein L23 [Kiritimatiellia bacterium]MCP5487351.1 50S ribosomal protein L23 [Verrucomicrobiota bacterium]